MIIYVAGKYLDSYTNPTKEGTMKNINKALDVGIELYKAGHYPMIPHLNYLLNKRMDENNEPPRDNHYWYKFDNMIIPKCDGLLKINKDGYSKGADTEEEFAKKLNIPVFHNIEEIKDYERHN